MRHRILIIGLSALVVFAGGCIIEPADSDPDGMYPDGMYPDEDPTSTATVGVSTTSKDTPEPGDEEVDESAPASRAERTGASTVGPSFGDRTNTDPTKPQPDPWDGIRWQTR